MRKRITIAIVVIIVILITLVTLGHFNILRPTESRIVGAWENTSESGARALYIFHEDRTMTFVLISADGRISVSDYGEYLVRGRRIVYRSPFYDEGFGQEFFSFEYAWMRDAVYDIEHPNTNRGRRFERVDDFEDLLQLEPTMSNTDDLVLLAERIVLDKFATFATDIDYLWTFVCEDYRLFLVEFYSYGPYSFLWWGRAIVDINSLDVIEYHTDGHLFSGLTPDMFVSARMGNVAIENDHGTFTRVETDLHPSLCEICEDMLVLSRTGVCWVCSNGSWRPK